MTEKKFGWRRYDLSASPDASNKDEPDGPDGKDAPAIDQPATPTAKTPAGDPPAPKFQP